MDRPSFDDADWDLPETPSSYHKSGRLFAYSFWITYRDSVDFKDVKGFQRYPLAADKESFALQVGFMLKVLDPALSRLKTYVLSPYFLPESPTHKSYRAEIRKLWAGRPKRRRRDGYKEGVTDKD